MIHSSKGFAHRSEGQLIVTISCLQSAVLGATPLLSAHLRHKETIDSISLYLRMYLRIDLRRLLYFSTHLFGILGCICSQWVQHMENVI